jgi:replicative DNA helicase
VFYDLRNQTIWDELVQMYEANIAVDVITLQQRLKDKNLLEQIGGIAYLAQLQDSVPSAANLDYYNEIVLEKYVLRKYIATCTDVVGRIFDYEGQVDVLMDEVERDILAIRPKNTNTVTKFRELIPGVLQRIEDSVTRKNIVSGIPTGFADYDQLTGGLMDGDMIVIAARPALGKTSLLFNIAENVVLNQKIPVGIFSLEMTKEQLAFRTVCSAARVNARNIVQGFASEADFPRLTSAAGRLNNAELFIDDTPGLSILNLRARARRMVQQFNVKLFGVDYLQLLHSSSKRGQDNRQQEVSEISAGIKALAKELRVPIIVLSQLNRSIESSGWRRPRLSDLRESGQIEADADIVCFLYKPKIDDEDEAGEQVEAGPVNLLIAKSRNGPTGDVRLTFLRGITRFESAAKIDNSDMPGNTDRRPYTD